MNLFENIKLPPHHQWLIQNLNINHNFNIVKLPRCETPIPTPAPGAALLLGTALILLAWRRIK